MLLAASNRKPGFRQPKPAPPSWQVAAVALPRQATLMLEPASQWSSGLPHPQVASWLQPCSHWIVILKAGKWIEPLKFIPLTWKADHSQGLLSKLLFMFNWPELDHETSLSLKQNRGNCLAHVGKREDHNRGDQCLCLCHRGVTASALRDTVRWCHCWLHGLL